MKKLSSLLLLLSFCGGLGAQAPAQPSHEKKVHKENDKTFVQKDLPVYLHFSTSEGGEKHRLTSQATARYADPMYLDTEGINYIRSHWAVDPETGKPVSPQLEVLYELYADGLSPNTSISLTGAPRFSRGGVTYYGKGLQMTLTAQDGVSGVAGINYALNSNTYSTYQNPVAINQEQAHTLYFYAFDKVGNAEQADNRQFTVDLTPPSTNFSVEGIRHQETILAPSTRIALSSTDGLSGVDFTRFAFDGGSEFPYSSTIRLSGLSDGEHSLAYFAQDEVENRESTRTFKFYLDRIAPVPSHKVVGDQYQGNYLYVSARTNIELAATDNKAGVKSIEYRVDGSGYSSYASAFKPGSGLGLHSVQYRSTDNVENTSGLKSFQVYVDDRAPSTGINYGSPQFFDRDTLFINKDTRITLRKSDAHSGLKSTEYKIDGGSYQSYSPFTIPTQGFHKIIFRSTDRVNNVEADKESEVFVDNTGPQIYVNFSIKPIGEKDGLKVYPNYTRLYIGATDQHCGTEEIFYSINGGALRAYSSPYSLDISEVSNFTDQKKYEVRIVSKDKLGNASEETVSFYVGSGS